MARLASVAKAGYYPTPERVTEWIAGYLQREEAEGGRLLDPCAGEGIAASYVAETFHLESYGVELDYERATQASYKMDHIIPDDVDMAKISREAFEVLWLNPPYDVVQGKRLEHKFLTHCTQFLAPDGILIYIVPQYVIGAKIAGYLAKNYHSLCPYRFPDPEYGDFRQIVVFGIKRASASDETTTEEEALHRACAGTLPVLAETPDEAQQYRIPAPHLVPDFYFYAKNLSDAEMIELIAEGGACTTPAWQEHFDHETELDAFRPLMRLKQGHLISLIAAGYIQNIRLEREDESILVKGRTYKKQVENEDEESKRVTDTFVTELVVLDLKAGEFEHIDDTSKLTAFSEKWNSILLQQVLDSYPPVYNMDYETALPPEKVQLLSSLSAHRRLPRRNICGLFEAQKQVAAALYFLLRQQKNVVLVGEMSTGKAQPLDAKVLTPSGWTQMGNLQVGDPVIGADGKCHKVEGVFPQGEKDVYRVWFSDGSWTECCDDHLWQVNSPLRKWKRSPPRVLPLREIRQKLAHANGNLQHFIPLVKPIEFETRDFAVDPYVIGVLLGDGNLEALRVTTADPEVCERVRQRLPAELSIKKVKNTKYDYAISTGRRGKKNAIRSALAHHGLIRCKSYEKFIPAEYFCGSIDQRIALLQGLLDTDGTTDKRQNGIEFSTTSGRLAEDVQALTQSLGGTASLSKHRTRYSYKGEKRAGRVSFRVRIKLPVDIKPFALSRKANVYRIPIRREPTRSIQHVEWVRRAPVQCINVDAPDGLYVTDNYVVTHNTTMGTALAALMGKDANPVFIMCPAHLVAKWKREILEILPGAYVEIVERIADVARFVRTVNALPHEQMAFAICSKEMAKLGSGTEPSYMRKQHLELVKKEGYDLDAPLAWKWIDSQAPRWIEGAEGGDGDEDAMRDEDREKEDDVDVQTFLSPSFLEQAYLACGYSYEPGPDALLHSLRTIPTVEDGYITLRERICCAHCGAEARDAEDRLVGPEYFENKKRFCSQCKSPFFQLIHLNQGGKREVDVARLRTIRYPIAEFIRRNLQGFFGLFLADEVHEAKGHSTDVGYALSALEQACRHTLGMTGTLYGGYSSTLFSLLYRLDPKIRTQYRWNEMQRFVARYGILEEVTFKGNGNVDDEDEFGVYTAKRRSRTYVRERPGISPELIVRLLNYTAFVQLADLGYDLVPLKEHLVEIDLAQDHRDEYAKLQGQLEKALEALRENGQSPKRLLAAYLQSLLGYVNSGHREEIVHDPHGGVIAVAKGLGEDRLYPKEQELLRIAKANVLEGRGVIIYLRQTGTRDITERLRKLIANVGLPVAVLKSSVSSTKREAWITKQVQNGVKVLITNMQLVQTGLDLIDFPTMIFAEPNYSVFTMQQALRRPLRLTQEKDVRAYYLVYQNTMESAAVSLIMEKVAAAVKVNGDSLEASLMASQASADDVLSQLGKVLQGATQVKDLHEIFREKEQEAAARRAQEIERLRVAVPENLETFSGVTAESTSTPVRWPSADAPPLDAPPPIQLSKTPEFTTGVQATLF